jgi:predicted TIM-barrel fold metal-dependent hydrolase
LIKQQHNLIKKHPRTNFIIAHFGWFANNLDYLGKLLDTYPNMNIEFGAVIAELGRQPRMAKKFFERYQNRILFGKDSWVPSEYSTYFRVLETEDEYFPYHKKYHAYWKMYGIGLSDEVLKKVYYKNAIRLIPGIDRTQFPN